MKTKYIKCKNILERNIAVQTLHLLGYKDGGWDYKNDYQDSLYVYVEDQEVHASSSKEEGKFVLFQEFIKNPTRYYKDIGIIIKVKLNDDYLAEVSMEGIRVGCQIFPLNVVGMLAEAIEKVQDR